MNKIKLAGIGVLSIALAIIAIKIAGWIIGFAFTIMWHAITYTFIAILALAIFFALKFAFFRSNKRD